MLQSDKQTPAAANRDARAMVEPGVLTAMLNWHRAIRCRTCAASDTKSPFPRCMCGATVTPLCLRRGHETAGATSAGTYRFEILHGTHWILNEQPDAVAGLLLEWLAAHPA